MPKPVAYHRIPRGLLLPLLFSISCGDDTPATALVLVADWQLGGELDGINAVEFSVQTPSGGATQKATWEPSAGRMRPAHVTVVPDAAEGLEDYVVTVRGLQDTKELVRRKAVVQFVRNAVRVVELHLVDRCSGANNNGGCPDDLVCSHAASTCTDRKLASSTYQNHWGTGGQVPTLPGQGAPDGGTTGDASDGNGNGNSDSGTTAGDSGATGGDSGTTGGDSGTNSSSGDGGPPKCESGQTRCDPDNLLTFQSCSAGTWQDQDDCETKTRGPCSKNACHNDSGCIAEPDEMQDGTSCGSVPPGSEITCQSGVCTGSCSTPNCTLSCEDTVENCKLTCEAKDCTATCDGTANCEILCSSAGECNPQCLGGASCLIQCGTDTCNRMCTGEEMCSESVYACNGASCP